jgi:hypothetical protein
LRKNGSDEEKVSSEENTFEENIFRVRIKYLRKHSEENTFEGQYLRRKIVLF